MEYTYTNINEAPNLATYDVDNILISGIHYDVENSSMSDKSLESCRWDEDCKKIKTIFSNSINAGDKTILDQIVVDNS